MAFVALVIQALCEIVQEMAFLFYPSDLKPEVCHLFKKPHSFSVPPARKERRIS
jgi:hypothetical protein